MLFYNKRLYAFSRFFSSKSLVEKYKKEILTSKHNNSYMYELLCFEKNFFERIRENFFVSKLDNLYTNR